MHSSRVEAPRVSAPLRRMFTGYLAWYLRRNLHSLRLARCPEIPASTPLIVCMNHPSWWDPLIALTLAYRVFPDRTHYGPIEAAALSKYKFFEKLGFFGIDPGTAAGAARFLRISQAILDRPGSALWITAQGTFVDSRVRPTALRPGIGHLARRLSQVAILPLALEFPFWEERFPECLARFGDPVLVENGRSLSAGEWTARIAAALEQTQDLLAAQSIARDRRGFETLMGGRSGVGGMYDMWRALKSWAHGRRFDAAHRPESH